MVLISWEEESRRLRGKDIAPCRLLFLDEAARFDGKSIATLFELCERQDMQLLIAAPENISPEKGTTYKLIRKVQGKHEHVHVVGAARLWLRRRQAHRLTEADGRGMKTGGLGLPFYMSNASFTVKATVNCQNNIDTYTGQNYKRILNGNFTV